MEKRNFWERLIDEYSAEQFEEKVFPWCIGGTVLLIVAWVISFIINPWMIVVVPMGIIGVMFVGIIVLLLACAGSHYVRRLVEAIADDEFRGG